METIIVIIIGFVVLCFIYGLACVLITKFPQIIWIASLLALVVVWVATEKWWGGLIAGFICLGLLSHMEKKGGGKKCAHCGSYDTYKVSEGADVWRCNKCDGTTAYYR